MRRPVVAGNWKMNGSPALVETAAAACSDLRGNLDVVLIPPALFVAELAERLAGSRTAVGVQNVHDETAGAFTGELSAQMAADCGAEYALVGHSERRALFGETDEWIAAKFAAAGNAGLVPILCVGETLEQRRAGAAHDVVLSQVRAVLEKVGAEGLQAGMVAYEPIWAIGTGETATPDQAQEMHAVIRDLLAAASEDLAAVRILYGGSVKADNAVGLFQQPDIDGGLVGGASLEMGGFMAICEAAG